MFELPEIANLSAQMNKTLAGKVIREGRRGNSPHKFVWYNRKPAEFAKLTRGKKIGKSSFRGKWLFLPVNPGYVLVLGEFGGKALYHEAGAPLPKKYHLLLNFTDGSSFTVMTAMWGAMELYEKGKEKKRPYIRGMRTTPVDADFTPAYFNALVKEVIRGEKRSAKGLLTQDQLIPGLGNAVAQDILFIAGIHPRHPVADLDPKQVRALFRAIRGTVREAVRKGGRNDEADLFNRPGGYVRLMDKHAAGRPCPECGRKIEKIQYLGGACYFCPRCQQ
ncbi:MAG: DNA-formamidopyrimidine glycosylase family protein [Anaerolineales bacterium]